MPRWSKIKEESKKVTPMKRRMLMDVRTFDNLDKSLEIEIGIEHTNDYDKHKVLKRRKGHMQLRTNLKIVQ